MSKSVNWKAVIGSLLGILQDAGYEIVAVDDGGDDVIELSGTPRTRRQAAKGHITGVDESTLWVFDPVSGKRRWLWIVLGNQPHETVADFVVDEKLEKTIDIFINKWEAL